MQVFADSVAAWMLVAMAAAGVAQEAAVGAYRITGSRIAIAQDARVERDEEVTDAVVVLGGSLTVDGRVRDGVLVAGGDLTMGPTADVRGDIVLVGGRLVRDPAARHTGRVHSVAFGGWRHAPPGWWPGVDFGELGRWLRLAGAALRASVLVVLMMFVLLVARAPVARVGRAAAAAPFRAALVGVAAALFFVPALVVASIALAMTIVGIPLVAILVPVAIAVACVALLLGFTGVACRVGERVERLLGWRAESVLLAAAIGFVLILGPTLAAGVLGVAPPPIRAGASGLLLVGIAVECAAWTIGLGAAILTGLGRWHTTPPPIPMTGQDAA